MNTVKKLFIICLSLISGSLAVQAQDRPEKIFDTFTLYWENDSLFGTDRDYTNGIKFSWSTPLQTGSPASRLPDWSLPVFKRLPFFGYPELGRAVAFSIGQNIYTPEDTQRSDLIEDDRPYAGFTYLAFAFHSQSDRRKDTWEFTIGIIGPHSYAEDIQNGVHDLLDSRRAKGWDHQLEDEIGLNTTYEIRWRLLHGEIGRGFSYDVIPHLGGSLGNVSIYANAGAEIRIGWNLPSNFGTCPIRAGCETTDAASASNGTFIKRNRFGIHLFAAADGRGVLRDIFLDGNTFTDSHSVDKEPFVADLMAGIGMEYNRIKANYSYIYRTKQFETQEEDQVFGAINVSYAY